MREYSMMNGNKYGAESCTIVPIMLTLPQLKGSTALTVVFVVVLVKFTLQACLNISSKNSLPFIPRLASSATKQYKKQGKRLGKCVSLWWVSTVSNVMLEAVEVPVIESFERSCCNSGEHLPYFRNSRRR